MSADKTIELYLILKRANPKGNFSDYESVLRKYEADRLSRFVASLRLPPSQAANFIFFEPKTRDVVDLHNEIDEYISALRELEDTCAGCVNVSMEIGDLGDSALFGNGKVDLSSVNNVMRILGRLRSARGASYGGRYFSGEYPLLVLLKPALQSAESYSKDFDKRLDDYIAAQSVTTDDVERYFRQRGYTYVSNSTVSYVEANANKNLTATISRYTRASGKRLAWSMLWRIFLLLVALAVPTVVLSFMDVRLSGFEWYWWMLYIVTGIAAGIVPQFVFGAVKARAYPIRGNIKIRMFLAPFLVSCACLAATIVPVAVHNGVSSIVFASVYLVLYVVGTAVKYNFNRGNDCNDDNTWGLKTILGGLFVALFSFCFGNLLLENRAAYLTVNILAALAYAATLFAGRAFTDFVDSLDGEFSSIMSFVLPIAAFMVGQAVQCSLYGSGRGVLVMSAIFGEIPLPFMILSAICCAACTALICANGFLLFDNDKFVRGWIFVAICSICFAAIPCLAGALGIVVLPVLTFWYFDTGSFALGVAMLVLFYVLGQFVQYYFYVVGGSTLATARLLARIPLWLQIVSTVAGAVAVGLTIYCYKEGYYGVGAEFTVFIPSILLGALPAATSIPLVVVMSILTGQSYNETDKEHMTVAPMIAAFVTGQTFMWWNFADTGEIFPITDLLGAFGVTEPIPIVFPIISSIFGAATCVLAIVAVYRLFDSKRVALGLWVIVPFVLFMLAIPAASSIPLFAIILPVTVLSKGLGDATHQKREKRIKRAKSALCVGTSVVIGLHAVMFAMTFIDFTHFGKYSADGVYYDRQGEYYYVVDCESDKELLVIPRSVKGHEVAGVSDEFKQKHPSTVYSLNYEYADGNDDAGMVIVLNFSTERKFPVPQRDGYTFYGWWSAPDRNVGTQITVGDGGLSQSSSPKPSSDIYAMWFGSDYRFISSMDEVKYDPNGKYVLTKDVVIEGNFTPVCGLDGMETQSWREPFTGVFDGNYHTVEYSIKGSRRYSGLFSWIGESGTVKNLCVDADIDVDFQSYSTEYYAFAGGIAAINDGTIENCMCKGSVKLKNEISVAFAAGIAGASGTYNMRSGSVKRCFNLASIESRADDSYASGILGSAENDGQTVSYCYNRGTIRSTGVNGRNTVAGGIISHGRTHSVNCFNAGAILTDYPDKQALGGISGYIRDTYSHNFPPENCAWLKAKGCQATWGVGKYPNDDTGGNNSGVTVVTKEDNALVTLLNAEDKPFELFDGKLRLAWERYL